MAIEIEQLALVLHSRPYRETSLLVTLLTPEQGKLNAVVKGVRSRSKTSAIKQAWLQPFQELRVRWIEKNTQKQPGLVNLSQFEPSLVRFPLLGDANICGLYVNELLYRLLYPNVPVEALYEVYQQTLYELAKSQTRMDQAWILRQFEYQLLMALGVALQVETDAQQNPIDASQQYRFYPELGAVLQHRQELGGMETNYSGGVLISGQCLLQFAAFERCDECLPMWKKLFRSLLSFYLGDKPIQTRALFQS